jgi:urea carboxylase
MVFFRPGDIVKFKPIDRAAYDAALRQVDDGTFLPKVREVAFDLREFNADIRACNKRLEGVLNDG